MAAAKQLTIGALCKVLTLFEQPHLVFCPRNSELEGARKSVGTPPYITLVLLTMSNVFDKVIEMT